jgi:hypothetical protein
MSVDRHARTMLPIPDRPGWGLTTYDAKDPDTAYPPIEPLLPPGSPNVLVVGRAFWRPPTRRSDATRRDPNPASGQSALATRSLTSRRIQDGSKGPRGSVPTDVRTLRSRNRTAAETSDRRRSRLRPRQRPVRRRCPSTRSTRTPGRSDRWSPRCRRSETWLAPRLRWETSTTSIGLVSSPAPAGFAPAHCARCLCASGTRSNYTL